MDDSDRERWILLESVTQLRTARRIDPGVIVISNPVNDGDEDGPKYHHRACQEFDEEDFSTSYLDRVRRGLGPNAQYWYVPTPEVAERGGARPCRSARDPLNH